MFKQLVVERFKSFGTRQEADLAPITLIYGPNSTGKSSLIQSLLLLSQTFQSDDPDKPALLVQGPFVNLGGMPTIAHRHQLEHSIRLGFAFETLSSPDEIVPANYLEQRRAFERSLWSKHGVVAIEFSFGWNFDTRTVELRDTTLSTSQEGLHCVFAYSRERVFSLADAASQHSWSSWMRRMVLAEQEWMREHGDKEDRRIWTADLGDRNSDLRLTPRFEGTRLYPQRIEWGAEATGRDRTPYERVVWSAWQHLSINLGRAIEAQLSNLAYLGPLRRAPVRYHLSSGGKQRHVGTEGQHYIEILGREQALVEVVNSWLERLQIPYTVSVARPDDEQFSDMIMLNLIDRRNQVRMSPSDVGFGISQLLPIVVECLVGHRTAICIEQPEIHIHPRLQAELADLLIAATREPQANQVIVETHSEMLILRLQRRMREGTLKSEDVSVLYVNSLSDGSAVVKRLRLDADGEFIDEWPRGFFEEQFNETFAR